MKNHFSDLAALIEVENGSGAGRTLTRRTVLKAGGVAITLGAMGQRTMLAQAQDASSATPAACVLTPELTEGPFYVESELVRQDITEGKPGVPLRLRIAVTDQTGCAPLANAAVDVWHCDAQGSYSGISGENPGGAADTPTTDENLTTTFLRGVQLTDDAGVAEFETLYPGWYMGRTVHIHMKVHVEGTSGRTYEGGHVAHTGQLFFDDAISDQVFGTDAYAGRDDAQRLRNDGDNIFGDHADEPGFLLELTPVTTGSIADGLLGTITVGVDPSGTPAATGPGGGGPGGPPAADGPGGPPPGGLWATPA
jgi:protocatechuate 3,4-dioxygenase beta subunit